MSLVVKTKSRLGLSFLFCVSTPAGSDLYMGDILRAAQALNLLPLSICRLLGVTAITAAEADLEGVGL